MASLLLSAGLLCLGGTTIDASPAARSASAGAGSPCPAANGYTVCAQHCVGQDGHCATYLAINRQCALGVEGCVAQAAANCTATPACHGFAVNTGCGGSKAPGLIHWQTFA